jgi:hypothetical protein
MELASFPHRLCEAAFKNGTFRVLIGFSRFNQINCCTSNGSCWQPPGWIRRRIGLTDPVALLMGGAVMGFFVNGMRGGDGALMSGLYPIVARATAQNGLFNIGRTIGLRAGRDQRHRRGP